MIEYYHRHVQDTLCDYIYMNHARDFLNCSRNLLRATSHSATTRKNAFIIERSDYVRTEDGIFTSNRIAHGVAREAFLSRFTKIELSIPAYVITPSVQATFSINNKSIQGFLYD